jgi:hypothetical protein
LPRLLVGQTVPHVLEVALAVFDPEVVEQDVHMVWACSRERPFPLMLVQVVASDAAVCFAGENDLVLGLDHCLLKLVEPLGGFAQV